MRCRRRAMKLALLAACIALLVGLSSGVILAAGARFQPDPVGATQTTGKIVVSVIVSDVGEEHTGVDIDFTYDASVLTWVSGRIKSLIRDGRTDDSRYKSRSEADQAVMVAMLQVGHTPLEIKAIFAHSEYGISKKYQEQGDAYLECSIGNAMAFCEQHSSPSSNASPNAQPIPTISPTVRS